jgi:hypothetical protein
MRPAFRSEHASIGPNEGMAEIILFDPPIRAAKSVILELPRSAFGGSGMPLRYRLSTPERAREK